jgi:superfamily II DNA helicase RecQ
VVIVSVNRAMSTDFITYISILRKRKLLYRIVLDEYYFIFTASDYRPKLKQLGYLQMLRYPIILLIAILLPIRLDELREVIYISDFRLIRMSTARPNIRYIVRRYLDKSILKIVKEIARLRYLEKGKRGIFYCTSRDGTEEVAKVLGCLFYYSLSDEKNAAIKKWLEDKGFIATTRALGTGGDYPGIVYIVYIGLPYSMIDFA